VNNRTVRIVVFLAVVVAVALLVRSGLDKPRLQCGFSGSRIVMGTIANITAVAENDETVRASIEAAFDKLVEADEMMSDYKTGSELSVVNRDAFTRPVKVSDDLFAVLKASLEYSRKSRGAFDITIGPVVELWRRMEKTTQKPTDEELARARTRVGYDKLILDETNRTVRFAVEGMKLDLGAPGAWGWKILPAKAAIFSCSNSPMPPLPPAAITGGLWWWTTTDTATSSTLQQPQAQAT